MLSVPSYLFQGVEIPGSVFAVKHLLGVRMPGELRRAIELVCRCYPNSKCLPRPELFTNGASRAWLDERLGGIDCHVCISDGTAVKIVAGLENDLFFYDSGRFHSRVRLRNLAGWAPEVYRQVRSQINSFEAVELGDEFLQPPTLLLLPTSRLAGPTPEIYDFAAPSASVAESAAWIVERGPVGALSLDPFREIVYAPLTDGNCRDQEFCTLIGQAVMRTCFQPDRCVLLRLPAIEATSRDVVLQIRLALQAIQHGSIVLPRALAGNVFLVTGDLPEDFLEATQRRLVLIFDETFEFWRYTRGLYAGVQGIRYWFGGDPRRLPHVIRGITSLFGAQPQDRVALQGSAVKLVTWRRGDDLKAQEE